jgi:AraC-like DNA-binding protein
MAYNEIEQRGTADFPIAYFHLDRNHSRYQMSAHYHTEIELVRILEGDFYITLNSNSYKAKKGDFLFINSEIVHQGTPTDCVYECIVFDAEFSYAEAFDTHSFMKSFLDGEYVINEYFPCGESNVVRALNNIFDSFVLANTSSKLRAISAFYDFFATVMENNLYKYQVGNNTVLNDKSIVKLKKILSYIRNNYDKPITLESIAETVHMSPKYLGTFFKNTTGKTPVEYLIEYRIEKAVHKLRFSDSSVTDIAFLCGFSDLSYFIKTFKKFKGVPPGKFREL